MPGILTEVLSEEFHHVEVCKSKNTLTSEFLNFLTSCMHKFSLPVGIYLKIYLTHTTPFLS